MDKYLLDDERKRVRELIRLSWFSSHFETCSLPIKSCSPSRLNPKKALSWKRVPPRILLFHYQRDRKIAQRKGTDSFSVFTRSAVHVPFELWLGIPDLSWQVDDHRSHTSSCKSQTNTPQRKKALLRPWYPISGSHAASSRSSRSCSRSSTNENGWSPGKETIPKLGSWFCQICH